jgi:acyl-CoA thioesterase
MLSNDAFSQWLGISLIAVSPGSCELSMQVREEMTNGFNIAHGGITYSLADSALAFAANGYGIQAVSIETAIAHTQPLNAGDIITAIATEKHRGKKTGIYEVSVFCEGKMVALFKGTVYLTSREWQIDEQNK